ncbi:MAG: hypothetical protein ACK552_03610, partial [Microcystis sp.]
SNSSRDRDTDLVISRISGYDYLPLLMIETISPTKNKRAKIIYAQDQVNIILRFVAAELSID